MADEELGVLQGVDVVGDDGHVVAVANGLAEAPDEGGLAGADGSADADPDGALGVGVHESPFTG